MAANETTVRPTGLEVRGDPRTDEVHLRFQSAGGDVTTIILPPPAVAHVLQHLSICVLNAPNPNIQAIGRMYSLRSISAQTYQQSMVTLRYELELGVSLETTLDKQDAQRLHQELSSSLALVQNTNSSQAH